MFDILGGFVVKFLPTESLGRLRSVLSELTFDRVALDGSQIGNKAALHEALYRAMNFAAFWSGPTTNWDSLSDLLWQWVMGEAGHEVTKLAFVIENAPALLSCNPELVFQFAEICIHLETIVREARNKEREPPLQVRVFLVG
jgi:hypothetical protein